MALFGKKKTEESKEQVKVAKVKVVAPTGVKKSFVGTPDVIIRPHITEKSGILSQKGVYTFEVNKNANKVAITRAISTLYKVTPTKVAIINLPTKKVFVHGRRGSVSGIRKAMVTLKNGDKIDFV